MLSNRLNTRLKLKLALVALLAIVVVGGNTVLVEPAVAQDKKKLSKEEKEKNLKYKNTKAKQSRSVGTACAKKIDKVQELIEEEKWAAVKKDLNSALTKACSTGYEKTQVWNLLGYASYSLDDVLGALRYYRMIIEEPEADDRMRTSMRYTVAQLCAMQEDFACTVKQLEKWLEEVAIVDPGGKYLLSRAYYETGRVDDALKLINQVISDEFAAGNTPKESWLSFQWAIYYEKEDYKSTIPVSHHLLTYYPATKYWKQLAAMHASLENEQKALLTLELAYIQNGVKLEREIVALAYQYLAFEVPFKAAKVLQKGIDAGIVEKTEENIELLGSSYQRAQEFEKASPILEQAAKMSKKGNAYSRLASVYLNLDQNEKALLASRKALKKGGLDRADLTWMNKGSAETALHCYKDAAKSFRKALKSEKTKKGASNWLKYVEYEGNRRQKLIANGAKLATCKKV